MSYSKQLADLSNNDLNKFTVNGKVIAPDQLNSLLNELINSSRADAALEELINKNITQLNFLSPNLKFTPMTIKLIKGDNVNVKE